MTDLDGSTMLAALQRLEARLVEEFRGTFGEAERLRLASEQLGKRRTELETEMHAVARAMDFVRRLA